MILQRISTIVGDAGFEPGTSAPRTLGAWVQCCGAGAGRRRNFLVGAGAGVKVRLRLPALPKIKQKKFWMIGILFVCSNID